MRAGVIVKCQVEPMISMHSLPDVETHQEFEVMRARSADAELGNSVGIRM